MKPEDWVVDNTGEDQVVYYKGKESISGQETYWKVCSDEVNVFFFNKISETNDMCFNGF